MKYSVPVLTASLFAWYTFGMEPNDRLDECRSQRGFSTSLSEEMGECPDTVDSCQDYCSFAYNACLNGCSSNPMPETCKSNCRRGYEYCVIKCRQGEFKERETEKRLGCTKGEEHCRTIAQKFGYLG